MNTSIRLVPFAFFAATSMLLAACGQPLVQFGEDAGADTTADTVADTGVDTTADTTADTAPDTTVADTMPDTTADTMPDIAPDVDEDTEPPSVITTVPRDGEVGYPVYESIEVVFDEPMDPASLDSSTLTVSKNGTAVSGTVSVSNATATFVPDSTLEAGATYDAKVTTGATDLAGNGLTSDYTWSFDTADPAAPEVTATHPAHLATNVALTPTITATFDQMMKGSSIDDMSFQVTTGGSPVSGSVTATANQATFTPDNPLQTGTDYTVTITTDVKSKSGIALQQDYVWSFTTVQDPGIPTVTLTKPLDLKTNVAPHGRIRAWFSEPMDRTTIDASSFTLTQNANPISGKVRIRQGDTMAMFIPDAELDPNKTYRATLTTAIQDKQGKSLAADYVWTFSTGDTVRPTLITADPADGDTGVPVDTDITVKFSKEMDASTLNTTNFKLERNGMTVSGMVNNLTTKTATFVPSSDLSPNKTYTVTVTTGVTDRAGNPLVAASTWSFTTAGP